MPFRTVTAEAVRFWERRRLVYNGALAAILLSAFTIEWPRSREWLGKPCFPTFVESAVIANLLYCTAYLAEFLAGRLRYSDRCSAGGYVFLA